MSSEPDSLFLRNIRDDSSDGEEDDNISITSTVAEPGGDFDVQELLCERVNPENPDEIQFLIRWEGYPLDQCTWEPRDHLGDGVFEGWQEAQAEISAGRRQPFDMNEYYNAIDDAGRAKSERHERRNAKRKKLGLPLTEPLPSDSPVPGFTSYNDDTDDEDEAVEMNEIDPGHLPNSPSQPGARSQTQKVNKQKIFQGIPSPNPRNEVPAQPRRSSITTTPKPQSKSLPKPSQEPTPKPRSSSSSTITGYQGTARPPASRKPSISIDTRITKNTSSRPPTPTAKASSSSAPSGAVVPPFKPASSLRDKFSGKKATRTRSELQPIPNVFTGGKQRQRRKNLRDVMSDPTKNPKQFPSMRIQNLARKRGIELNDAAPTSISSIPAAFILNNDQVKPKPLQGNFTESPTNLSPKSPTPQPTPTMHSTAVNSPDEPNEAGAPPKKAKKKSVRFSDAEDLPSMSENFDPVLGEHVKLDGPLVNSETSSTTASSKKKLSLANYQGRSQDFDVSKTCSFGKNGSTEIQVAFTHIPRQSQQSLSTFLQEEKLDFNRLCSSFDFMFQRGFLCQETYSSGILDAGANESASILENVAEHMRRRSSGLYLIRRDYSILVYPTKCNGWQDVLSDPVQQDSTDSPMRYTIFKTPIDVREYPTNIDIPIETTGKEDKPTIERLTKLMLDLDFSTLTTHNSRDQDKQVFMLMFPPEDVQLLRVIILWLRSCQPDCRIFTSEIKGSFAKFIELTKRGTGTIIFHEEVTTRIRRIPLLWQMIEKGVNYTFWSLATGRRTPPRYPSRIEFDLKPNQHFLTELFPSGRAFFVTPSFVISDPIKFYEFVQWFGYWCHNPRYLLVTSADFPSWLQGLCLEKSQEWWRYQQNHSREPNFDQFVRTHGLTKDRTDALVKAWQLLKKIMADYGDEETHESVRRIMWAPREINPNDEQSLVNWFFWWSTTSLDCHRRFFVLGSNARNKTRAYRIVRIPNYDMDQSLDPEELVEKSRLKSEAEEQKVLALWDAQSAIEDSEVTTTEHGSGTPTGRRKGSFISQAGLDFPSNLFQSDRADVLKTWLVNLSKEFHSSWATPFWQPVSWQDIPMADHFGDHSCEYANFTHWLSACQKFWRAKNTWFGLFYTPSGKWDPAKPSHTYKRHPWIAIFRPVNPHIFALDYTATELLIWDLNVKEAADLSDMQLRLIDFVRKESSRLVCSSYYLKTVWYSNRTGRAIDPQDHPLDATCLQLREMIGDAKFWLPPFDKVLSTRGWNELPLSEVGKIIEQQQRDTPSVRTGHQRPFPRHPRDSEEPVSFVWLPPRGTVKHFRCYNDLYEAAYQNRVKNDTCREFRYTYRPTLEWYEEQKKEGRHFSYVNVDAGDRILDRLPRAKSSSKPK